MTTTMHASHLLALPLEEAYDRVIAHPLPELGSKRYLAIPPIREVRDQDGAWGRLGQTRTIVLGDGGTMREELTTVERPARFGYQLTRITGPMKPLVGRVEGTWAFAAEGDGTRVTWSWIVHPRGLLGRAAMGPFKAMWERYAATCLAGMAAALEGR